jgi:hypothetical protein
MSTAQRRRIGWLVMMLSLVAIVASFPVDGLAGAALGIGGIGTVWVGHFLVVRSGGAR